MNRVAQSDNMCQMKAHAYQKNLVSVIIPNWNGRQYIEPCLRALFDSSYSELEVIVVDNGSKDDSVKYVEMAYPDVSVVRLKKNKGFARACNEGISASNGEYLFLLNNDVEVEKDCIAELVASLKRHTSCLAAATKMINFKRRDLIDAAGDAMTIGGAPYNRGHDQPDTGQFDREEIVFGACAGAALYRRELFRQIGVFDTDFFAYMEDVDLSLRAALAGNETVYVPTARCYHHGSASFGALSPRHVYLTNRNKLCVMVKNYPIEWIMKHFGEIVKHQVEMSVLFSETGRGFSFFRSRIALLWRLPKMAIKHWTGARRLRIDKQNAYNLLQKANTRNG